MQNQKHYFKNSIDNLNYFCTFLLNTAFLSDMKYAEHLHQLIHSLSKSEKRYIKISINKYNKTNTGWMLQLFEAIEQQQVYNEEKIKEKFKNTTLFTHLSSFKVKLYYKVLRLLKEYKINSNNLIQKAEELIELAEILHEKNLNVQAKKLLKKSIKICQEYEYPTIEISAINLLIRIHFRETKLKGLNEVINTLAPREEKLLEYSKEQLAIRKTQAQLAVIHLNQHTSDTIDIEIPSVTTDSVKNRISHADLEATVHMMKKNHQKTLAALYTKKKIQEENGVNINSPYSYINTLNNILIALDLIDKKEAYDYTFEIERTYQALPKESKSKLIYAGTFLLINSVRLLYLKSLDMQKAQEHLYTNVLPYLEEYEQMISMAHRMPIISNSIITLFLTKDYKNALQLCNSILNDSNKKLRIDLKCHMHLLNILIHYELNGFDQLNYIVLNARTYIQKHKRYQSFEKTFVKFFLKHARKNIPVSYNSEIFTDFIAQLKEVSTKENDTNHCNEFFPFIQWLEAKTQKRIH